MHQVQKSQFGRLIVRLFACCAALSNQGLAAAELPVADFVKSPQFMSPKLSPDGLHLVVNQAVEKDGRDTRVMVVYDLTHLKIVSTVGLPYFEVPVTFNWITNSRLAVAVGREYGSLERAYLTGEILAMDLDGGNQEYLYGHAMYSRSRRGITMADDEGFGTVAFIPVEHNGHFLMTEHLRGETAKTSRVYDINARTAARSLVTEIGKPGFDFLMQNDGKPRYAFGTEESSYYAVYRFDDATSGWRELPGEDKKSEFRPWAILPGDKDLIATLSIDGGPRQVVRQSLADGSRTVMASSKTGSFDIVEMGPRPSVPFAVATEVGVPKPVYVGEETAEAKLHKTLSAQFTGSYVHFINYSDDGKLLFSVASDKDPGAYYLFDKSTNRASFLFAARPWIDPEKMADRRPISFKARDGKEIYGYLTLPPNRGDGAMPMILLPHGGPHGVSDDWFFDTDSQFLASRGYAVLQINFRGSRGRGPAFETSGYRRWGGLIQDDLIDGVHWAVAQGNADESRICAYGGSFGAYASMMIAAREPTMLKCAVGYSGLYDLAQKLEDDETRRSRSAYNYWVKVVGTDPAELASFSPTKLASKIKVPVLLVHGSRDTRTPPLQAETMREALTKAGNPPQWMYVDQEGHGFYAVKNRQAFYERLEKFLADNMKK